MTKYVCLPMKLELSKEWISSQVGGAFLGGFPVMILRPHFTYKASREFIS